MKLLFICTHNRCRSILAEAITNHIAGDRITAVSAGSSPQGAVHPMSLKYLQEHEIAVNGLSSQSWDEFEDFSPDAIVTLCDNAAEEVCPVWFDNAVQVHWGLEDPSKGHVDDQQQQLSFNNTISILERRVQRLLKSDLASFSSKDLRNELEEIARQVN